MSKEVNIDRIRKILGAKVRPVKQVRFGNFPLLETTAEVLRTRTRSGPGSKAPTFSPSEDKMIVQAFEDTRRGLAPDAILWDKGLAQAFYRRCRELGLEGSEVVLGRRLLYIRKNSSRFKRDGLGIAPTTKSEPHISIVPRYAHVIEFALVRLRYRYGASIDEILLDPALSSEFEALACEVAAGLTSEELRLGALYIRKTRSLTQRDVEKVKSLNTRRLEAAWGTPIALEVLHPEDLPASPGLMKIAEPGRCLYIAQSEDLRAAADQLRTGQALKVMANGFWEPDPKAITLQIAPGAKIGSVPGSVWERRLIQEIEPVFNWPTEKKAG
jgi:hypothetical protein